MAGCAGARYALAAAAAVAHLGRDGAICLVDQGEKWTNGKNRGGEEGKSVLGDGPYHALVPHVDIVCIARAVVVLDVESELHDGGDGSSRCL